MTYPRTGGDDTRSPEEVEGSAMACGALALFGGLGLIILIIASL